MNRWGVKLEGLGSMVMELTDGQMMKYLQNTQIFENLIGRYPDYFEERDIIRHIKSEK